MLGLWIAWRRGRRHQARRDTRERDELLDEIEFLEEQLYGTTSEDDDSNERAELVVPLDELGALLSVIAWIAIAIYLMRSG